MSAATGAKRIMMENMQHIDTTHRSLLLHDLPKLPHFYSPILGFATISICKNLQTISSAYSHAPLLAQKCLNSFAQRTNMFLALRILYASPRKRYRSKPWQTI